MSDTIPEVNMDSVSETFDGQTSTYSVIATRGQERLGCSIDYVVNEYAHQSGLIVRFATYIKGKGPQVFKHFTPRSQATFLQGDNGLMGIRLDKLTLPIFSTEVSEGRALEVGNTLGVWDAVGAWLADACASEGFTPSVLSLANFVRSEIEVEDNAGAAESIFVAPLFSLKPEKVINADPDEVQDEDEDDDEEDEEDSDQN